MSASSTITTLSPILKERYLSPDLIKDVQVESGPLLAELLDRAQLDVGGKTIPFPIIQASGGGVGSVYTAAFASTQPANSQNFELTRSSTFGVLMFGGEVLLASEGQQNSFIPDFVLEFDAKRKRMAQLMATYVYNDGKGVMGQVISTQSLSSTTVTLQDPATAVHFQIGDVVQLQATYGGANRAMSGGTAVTLTNGAASYTGCCYVVGVNLVGTNAGTIQLSASAGGSAASLNTLSNSTVSAGDYISLVGDCNTPANVGGSGNAIPSGLLAWAGGQNTSSIDAGGTFFGVTRSGSSFLVTNIIDATVNGTNAGDIRTALTQAVASLHAVSARPSMIVMHPTAWYNLSLSLQSQNIFPATGSTAGTDGDFGFDTLNLPTPHGIIKVVADPMCVVTLNSSYFPTSSGYSGSNIAFVLEMDTWEVVAVSEDNQIPYIQKTGMGPDGLLANIGQDIVFASLCARWQLGSHAPGHNAIVMLPPA